MHNILCTKIYHYQYAIKTTKQYNIEVYSKYKKEKYGNNKTNEKRRKKMKMNVKRLNNNNNRDYAYSTCDYNNCFTNFSRCFNCDVNRREWNTNSSTKGSK